MIIILMEIIINQMDVNSGIFEIGIKFENRNFEELLKSRI